MSNKSGLVLKNKIYDNQAAAAQQIVDAMKHEIKHCKGKPSKAQLPYRAFLLSAQMQSGKTGVIAKIMKESYDKLGFKNLWVISGVNLEDLRDQTQKAMPTWDEWTVWGPNVKSPVEVRNNPNNKDIRDPDLYPNGVRDAILVMDECHVGNQIDSVIDKLFDEIGISLSDGYNAVLQQLRKRNIFLIMVSATPYNAKYSEGHQATPPTFKHVALKPGKHYYGLGDMLKDGKIHDADITFSDRGLSPKLCSLMDKVVLSPSKSRNKYVVVRASKGRSEDICDALVLRYKGKVDVISFDMKNKDKFSQKHLTEKPKRPTVVIVKQFWRVGNVLDTTHVSFLWDTNTGINGKVDTVSQSFAGRACGYGKRKNSVDIYTSRRAVEDFVKEANGAKVSGDFALSKNIRVSKGPKVLGKPIKTLSVKFKPTPAFDLVSGNQALTKYVRGYLESLNLNIIKRLSKMDDSKLHLRNKSVNKTRNFEANLKLARPTAGMNNGGAWNSYCVWYEIKEKIINLYIVEMDKKKTEQAQKVDQMEISQTANLFNS